MLYILIEKDYICHCKNQKMANDNALFTTKIRNLIFCAGKILHFSTTNLQTGTGSNNSTLKCHYLLSYARLQTKSQEKKCPEWFE